MSDQFTPFYDYIAPLYDHFAPIYDHIAPLCVQKSIIFQSVKILVRILHIVRCP